MFVITLVRINWKKESEKAMKCAGGHSREQPLQTAELNVKGDGTIIENEVPQEGGEFVEMKEVDLSETGSPEESIKAPEQGEVSFHCKG